MPKESLTAKQVEHMKPRATRYEVPAGPPKGLYLVVQPTGAKSWAFRYRFNGKTRKLTYTEMGLAAARAEAQSAVENLENNIDPARTKANEAAAELAQQQADALQQESVKSVAEQFIKRGLKKKEKERGETERIVRREIIEPWKHRGIADIRKPDIVNLLDTIVDRGASVMACRTRGVLLRFFKFARKRGYIEVSPAIDVEKPGPDHQDRERVLEPAELSEVWAACGALGYPVGPFIRLSILTAQRRGEVATMRWRHVDLEKAVWTLPAEATKGARVHDVPLSGAAVELLEGLSRFTEGDYVFTTTSGAKPINGFSKAKERIDAETVKRRNSAGIEKNIPDWTMHDLRRTATTIMAETVPVPVLSAILNHSAGKVMGITKIYNRYRYMPERRAALEAWAQYVLGLTDRKPATSQAARA